jgi:hypothetical protein
MKNITLYTLGELLTHHNPTIRRLAGSILKLLQREATPDYCDICNSQATYIEKNTSGIFKRCKKHY